MARAALDPKIKAVVVYGSRGAESNIETSIPCLQHIAGAGATGQNLASVDSKFYTYPTVKSARFALPSLDDFDGGLESISHTRNLTFLKKYIHGADFDLEAIWDEHTYFEFAVRSVPKTMATMVQEPYVNHIPTVRRSFRVRILWRWLR